MTPAASRRPHWPSRRDLRWSSGLVLMAYAGLHLLNHALGLASLSLAEAVLHGLRLFWQTLGGTLLLYGAAAVHVALAALALWERRSLRMPPIEALRLLLGLSLPLLLASHVTAMRYAHALYGLEGTYARVVGGLWSPGGATFQLAMMAAAWAHGCLGLHLALRARAAYARALPWLAGLAIALPLLAGLGFLAMGRELAWTGAGAGAASAGRSPDATQAEALDRAESRAKWLYAAALLALLIGRLGRRGVDRLAGRVPLSLRYPGRTVKVPPGWSVLEASRAHGIAHMSLCGGRARCSTCRVRVSGAAGALPPPSPDERRTLARVRAPADVRLGCQLRPEGDLTVTPLFRHGGAGNARRFGHEREVAVLFVDLRRWSGLAERQLPFDLVYVLDRYFELVGQAVREAGGVPNQFIGDSVMALFGLEVDLATACRQAVRASELIGQRMDAWNAQFQTQFGQRLDFGMGLHAGRAAVGEVGYLDTTTFTAVGEVVNTASRLQDHTKAADARLVVSRHAAELAGIAAALGPARRIAVRGRSEMLDVLEVAAPQAGAAAR